MKVVISAQSDKGLLLFAQGMKFRLREQLLYSLCLEGNPFYLQARVPSTTHPSSGACWWPAVCAHWIHARGELPTKGKPAFYLGQGCGCPAETSACYKLYKGLSNLQLTQQYGLLVYPNNLLSPPPHSFPAINKSIPSLGLAVGGRHVQHSNGSHIDYIQLKKNESTSPWSFSAEFLSVPVSLSPQVPGSTSMPD